MGLAVLGVMVAAMACLCMGMGAKPIAPALVGKTLSAHIFGVPDMGAIPPVYHTIIWNIRMPRALLAIMTGICLAASGAVFQGCFKNPLVEPYILGISSGAAFGAALGIIFPSFFMSVQVLAFGFGFLAVGMAYTMARSRGETPLVSLVLSGIITGSVFAALVGIIKYLARDEALREIVFWLMGGFYYAGWHDVRLICPIALGGFFILWAAGWKLNILSMGDREARALGVDPEKNKLLLIGLATLMTAAAVSSVGIIAWVGLMIPHAARIIFGPDHRVVLPASALLGALYLLICDTIARNLAQAEIPIGIITSLIGAPYLFFLVRTGGRNV
ncbi:MAG: iron ABC transporter permease [Desulfobacter sp.]|nr:MAG: iron ABC transporter permease [Desulfobacter sp.]